MAFNSLLVCSRVSQTGRGFTLHEVSPVVDADAAAIVFYCTLSSAPYIAGLYNLTIYRISETGTELIFKSSARPVSHVSRLFGKQLLYVFAADGKLEQGYYSAILSLDTGERTSTEFIVV